MEVVYIVGDADKYGIEFAGEYTSVLLCLVYDQLKSESKSIIKSVDDWKKFQIAMGRIIVKSRKGLANGSEEEALKTYYDGQHYPHTWSIQKCQREDPMEERYNG